ncbi:MAG: HAMP domain-containing protein [Corynebacteriales bacterium]|nr:HAMP domain-containing protein [Mycobacteriales bacterium]
MPTSLLQGNHPTRDEDGTSPRRNAFVPAASSTNKAERAPKVIDETPPPKRPTKMGRLFANRPIRSKVALILVIPLVALLLFAGLRINDSRLRAQSAEELNELAHLGVRITELTHQLQEERSRVTNVLTASASPEAAGLTSQATITDESVTEFQAAAQGTQAGKQENVPERIDNALDGLDNLKALRAEVENRQLNSTEATGQYTEIITELLGIMNAITELARGDDEIADQLVALTAVSQQKEFAAQETAVGFDAILARQFNAAQYRALAATFAGQDIAQNEFRDVSNAKQRSLYDKTLAPDELSLVTETEQTLLNAEIGQEIQVQVDRWHNAMSKKAELLRLVETHIANDTINATTQARDEAIRDSLVEAASVLIALIIAIAISLLVARSMVGPLVRLRTSALDVAYQGLPDVVRKFRDTDPERSGETFDPQAEARAITSGVTVSSTDEIGQVAEAFNAVHHEAVRVAAEQAQLRQSVSAMFVNLARRSQLLVERLIRLIDKLEQGERDPDRLAELFRLDHLATRMRRNDENLLILAGAEGGRRWTTDAALVDVLRAAIAEVEQYTRVKLGKIDDVSIAARSVSDTVHLVAELLENATSFSSPRTDVLVDARIVGNQVVIEIEDQGIGMSSEQLDDLNARLAKPPVLDVSVSRMMGLFVVGRLSTRNNVRVMLRPSTGGGVLAIVALPEETLVGLPEPEPPAPIEPPRPKIPAALPQRPVHPQLPAGESAQSNAFVPPQRNGDEHSGAHTMVSPPEQPPNAAPTPTQWRYQPRDTEPTMEMPLPIFEQIESEWFRPIRSADSGADQSGYQPEPKPSPSQPEQEVSTPPPVPQHEPPTTPVVAHIPEQEKEAPMPPPPGYLVNEARPSPPPNTPTGLPRRTPTNAETPSEWETKADTGWQRAQEIAEPRTGDTTKAGLPRRVPMANFVPGAVEQPARPASHRSADAVRGVLSSYRRGLEQGRQVGRSRHTALTTEDAPVNIENVEEK